MKKISAAIKKWREDPVAFVYEELGAKPDPWQVDALRAFADPLKRRISMQACAGPGKSAVLAWIGWNFMLCYGGRGEHPNAAVMSITRENLKDNLWKELAVWRNKSKLLQRLFEQQQERIFARDHPETWFMSARSVPKKSNAEEQGRTLSGLHSRFILYLIDESGDQQPPVLRSAEQGLGNCEWGKIVQSGNPTSHSGMLYLAATTQRHLWAVIQITGDPDDPKRSPRISMEWAREQIKLYGRENPWVMAYILGKFPPSSMNSLLSLEEVEAAMGRHLSIDKYAHAQKRLGIDAARFGDDPWVIFPRQGLAAFMPKVMRGPRSDEVAAVVAQAKVKWGSEMEFFDDTGGWASGAIDCLVRAGYGPIGVNYSGKAINPRYFNKRSEIHFELAEWVRRGGALPNVPELVPELTQPRYWFHEGKMRVEEKEQIKIKIGRSPNHADALANTFAFPDMPAATPFDHLIHKDRMAHDWNPHEERSAVSQQESLPMAHDFDPFSENRI